MKGEELASSIAFVVFSQALGPTIAMTIYNIIFLESLQTEIHDHAPNVTSSAVIQSGATGFRSFVSPTDLPGVLVAYANSIDRVFYLAAAFATICGVFLWGMGWHDLRKKDGDGVAQKSGGEAVEEGDKAA